MKKSHRNIVIVASVVAVLLLMGILNPQLLPSFQQQLASTFHIAGKLRNDMKPFYGTIISKTDTVIQVRNRDGEVAVVNLPVTTEFKGGSRADLVTARIVSGVGKVNDDKSITAKTIQINPTSFLNSPPSTSSSAVTK